MQISWVSSCLIIKAGRKGLFSMGLKVCKPSSLYQTQVRITRTFIVYCRMEELVTLHYGTFLIVARWAREFAQRASCSNWVAEQTIQSQLFLKQIKTRTSRLEHCPKTRMGPIPAGVPAPQWGCHVEERALKTPLRITIGDGWHSPWTPLCVDLLGSPDTAILEIAEHVYKGEWAVAPSILLHRQQDECMRVMHQEPTKCMTRAGLQSKTGPDRPSLRN